MIKFHSVWRCTVTPGRFPGRDGHATGARAYTAGLAGGRCPYRRAWPVTRLCVYWDASSGQLLISNIIFITAASALAGGRRLYHNVQNIVCIRLYI